MQKRNTIQRQLVISAVRSLSNHPTAEEVYNRMNVDDLDYFQDLDDKIAQMTGYRMENHNIVFQGVCPECQIEELEAKKREVEQAKAEGRKPDKISKKL